MPRLAGYQFMVANDVLARPLPQELREAGGDHAESRRRVRRSTSTRRTTRFLKGHKHHGAGAEQLVPAHRSQSADLRAEHLRGEGLRLQGGRRIASSARATRRRTSQLPSSTSDRSMMTRSLIGARGAPCVGGALRGAGAQAPARLGRVRSLRRAGGARLARSGARDRGRQGRFARLRQRLRRARRSEVRRASTSTRASRSARRRRR